MPGVLMCDADIISSVLWDQFEFSNSDGLEMELVGLLRGTVFSTRAEGTWDHSYVGGFGRFRAWCLARSPPRGHLPARPETVALYLLPVWLWKGATPAKT